MSYVRQVGSGFLSLLSGMWVTLKNAGRRPVTQQYPHERPQLSGAYRSAIALVRFEDKGTHDCVACMQCVNICPSYCISIEGEKPDGLKRKRATSFEVDYALCSVCGLCIDVCPTDTLKYSKLYDEVGYRRDAFVYDLLQDFRADEAAYLERARQEAASEAAAKKAKLATKAARPTKTAASDDGEGAPAADERKAKRAGQ